MSGNRFLLDTNILLYLIGKKIPVDALPEGEFSVSFVTELEVLYNLRLPDAIIAATALHLNATLVTNDKGFSLVKEIQARSIEQ